MFPTKINLMRAAANIFFIINLRPYVTIVSVTTFHYAGRDITVCGRVTSKKYSHPGGAPKTFRILLRNSSLSFSFFTHARISFCFWFRNKKHFLRNSIVILCSHKAKYFRFFGRLKNVVVPVLKKNPCLKSYLRRYDPLISSPTNFFIPLQQITYSILIWNSKKHRGSSTFFAHFIDHIFSGHFI